MKSWLRISFSSEGFKLLFGALTFLALFTGAFFFVGLLLPAAGLEAAVFRVVVLVLAAVFLFGAAGFFALEVFLVVFLATFLVFLVVDVIFFPLLFGAFFGVVFVFFFFLTIEIAVFKNHQRPENRSNDNGSLRAVKKILRKHGYQGA
jgi:hypothetical protein